MTYYFDSNILITANRYDFPITSTPVFWDWILEQGKLGIIKFPEAVYDEIGAGDDALCRWMRDNRDVFLAPYTEAIHCVPKVLNAYENPMKEGTLDAIRFDAFVIAHAMSCMDESTVVTYELPTNATSGKNKKIPSICQNLSIQCIRFPQFIWTMSKLGDN